MDQATFDPCRAHQLHDPRAFWSALPLPSVALDDALFVRPIPVNSWGGASQALTALRTGRWFDHYGKSAAHAVLMQRWCEALLADGNFRQQADPLDWAIYRAGQPPGYSPFAALVMIDFTWRLAGICESGGQLHWNVRPGQPVSQGARFSVRTDAGHRPQMTYDTHGALLSMDGRKILRLEGGAARVITADSGRLLSLVGIDEQEQHLRVQLPGEPVRNLNLAPGVPLSLTSLPPVP